MDGRADGHEHRKGVNIVHRDAGHKSMGAPEGSGKRGETDAKSRKHKCNDIVETTMSL